MTPQIAKEAANAAACSKPEENWIKLTGSFSQNTGGVNAQERKLAGLDCNAVTALIHTELGLGILKLNSPWGRLIPWRRIKLQ